MYTQHDEEKYFLDFFRGEKDGRLLEIGAYHPEIFSSSRALILEGWEAVLVEGSPQCYETIKKFYEEEPRVRVYNTLLNDYDGDMTFYDSAGAVGTGFKTHYDVWKGTQGDFVEKTLPCMTWKTFYNYIFKPKFDFISIDIEGMDWAVLKQIDLDETGTSLLCIEYTYCLSEILQYMVKYNFSVVFSNAENIILGRNL